MSTTKDQSMSTIFARWSLVLPFGLSLVITAQLLFQNGFLCFPKMGLRSQSIVPNDSEIIRACEAGDITRIQGIFKTRQARPNDRTTDDLTVLRVGAQAFPYFPSGMKTDMASSTQYSVVRDQSCSYSWTMGLIQISPLGFTKRV